MMDYYLGYFYNLLYGGFIYGFGLDVDFEYYLVYLKNEVNCDM